MLRHVTPQAPQTSRCMYAHQVTLVLARLMAQEHGSRLCVLPALIQDPVLSELLVAHVTRVDTVPRAQPIPFHVHQAPITTSLELLK